MWSLFNYLLLLLNILLLIMRNAYEIKGMLFRHLLDVCRVSSRLLQIFMDKWSCEHISVINHFVRDCVNRGAISISYTPTAEMFADGLTKLLGTSPHKYCKFNLGIRASLTPLDDEASTDVPSDSPDEDIYVGLAALMSSLNHSEEEGDSKS